MEEFYAFQPFRFFFVKYICVYSYVANFFVQMDKDIIKIEWAEENRT